MWGRPDAALGAPAAGHGPGAELASCHRYEGLRSHGFGRSLVMPWPVVKGLPPYGYVVTRKDLDGLVAGNAAKNGASLWEHTEAVEPITEGPSLRGARIAAKGEDGHAGQVTARYVVVADGANSRFGWSLGNQRKREYPQGMALRGYWSSPRHDEPWIDSWLDLKDEAGNAMPGYGWIFPLGDGRINVGVGLLSTNNRWKGVNTTQMLDAFCNYADASWGIKPETCLGPATGGRLPMGFSVGPRSARATWSWATPEARSTRSTARASPTVTRPAVWRPKSSTRRSRVVTPACSAFTRSACRRSTASTTG